MSLCVVTPAINVVVIVWHLLMIYALFSCPPLNLYGAFILPVHSRLAAFTLSENFKLGIGCACEDSCYFCCILSVMLGIRENCYALSWTTLRILPAAIELYLDVRESSCRATCRRPSPTTFVVGCLKKGHDSFLATSIIKRSHWMNNRAKNANSSHR